MRFEAQVELKITGRVVIEAADIQAALNRIVNDLNAEPHQLPEFNLKRETIEGHVIRMEKISDET